MIKKSTGSATSYTVTYDGNGKTEGTVPSAQTGATSYTVEAGTGLKKGTDEFVSWNTKSDGTGTTYNTGATITLTENVTLYAMFAAG